MGKRLIRIFQKDIPAQVKNLFHKELNLVLKNNTTLRGVLKKFENDFLFLEGSRSDKHAIRLNDITEIIYDKEALF